MTSHDLSWLVMIYHEKYDQPLHGYNYSQIPSIWRISTTNRIGISWRFSLYHSHGMKWTWKHVQPLHGHNYSQNPSIWRISTTNRTGISWRFSLYHSPSLKWTVASGGGDEMIWEWSGSTWDGARRSEPAGVQHHWHWRCNRGVWGVQRPRRFGGRRLAPPTSQRCDRRTNM